MQNGTKVFVATASVALSTLFGASHAFASSPIAIAGDNTSNFNISFSGGVGGALQINIPKGFLLSKVGLGFDPNVSIVFTTIGGSGLYTFNPATGVFDLVMGGAAFKVVDNSSGTVLLTGQFSRSDLHGTNNSSSASLTLLGDSVSYASGTPFFPSSAIPSGGSLSVEFVTKAPIIATSAAPSNFFANDGITFAAR
jgi:hypothetical protein